VSTSWLPRSTPSAQGVDADAVLAFIDGAESSGIELHSLMLVRRGHVVAEGWWEPYRPDGIGLVYSLSKSFTSTAIGIAQDEGLLSVDDPVSKYFPDELPVEVPSSLAHLKVRDLLSMSSGHAEDTWSTIMAGGPDLVRTFFSIPLQQEPGTLFCYNQGCTYVLSVIISRLTRLRLIDYVRPRLFDPLGIEEAHWAQSSEGNDLGFSGLHVATETIAKLGLLHLQAGRWEGEQLVSAPYMAAAHTKHVETSGGQRPPDWAQGYCWQFWVCRPDGEYRGDGAFGQFCVVLPEADAVVVCTAQCTDMQAELDLVWEHLVPALSETAPVDEASDSRLAQRLANLSTPVIRTRAEGPERAVTFTRVGETPPFTSGLREIRVEETGGRTRLTVTVDDAAHEYDLAPAGWSAGRLPGLHSALPAVELTGGWVASDRFHADIVWPASPHRLQLRAELGDNRPTFEVSWATTPL
jgi:CubicO group peptidase (beta-lactamase class C family)